MQKTFCKESNSLVLRVYIENHESSYLTLLLYPRISKIMYINREMRLIELAICKYLEFSKKIRMLS